MKRSLLIALLFLGLVGCRTNVSYTGLRPADVTLPQDVKSVVLLNRYKADRRNQWLNVVEGIFTGEIAFADRRGVDQALAALQGRLQSGPRYQVVMAAEQAYGTGTGMLPPPLDPAEVRMLCNQYNSQVLIAIEGFDSDIGLVVEPRQRKRTVNGKEVIEKFFEAIERVRINMSWRLYLASTGAIFDQHTMLAERAFSASGNTPDLARRGLLFPVDAIMQTAFQGGDSYGVRVSPSWVSYYREIYTRASGSGQMKKARRMAARGDWEQASVIWERLSRSTTTKIAKRATYNRAVAAEFMGDYDAALTWARKAADEFGMRNADQYVRVLQARLNELRRLDQQMEETKP
jgi:hypothetical protein